MLKLFNELTIFGLVKSISSVILFVLFTFKCFKIVSSTFTIVKTLTLSFIIGLLYFVVSINVFIASKIFFIST